MLLLQIVEGETRLKQQQSLYEAVRADRNLYSKNLIQAQDEIQEMKRKFQIMVRFLAYHTAICFSVKLPRLTFAWPIICVWYPVVLMQQLLVLLYK